MNTDRAAGQRQYERAIHEVRAAVRKVLQARGTLVNEDPDNRGPLVGRVDSRTVYVTLTSIEPTRTGVRVQARARGGGADTELAADIEKQIALNLR